MASQAFVHARQRPSFDCALHFDCTRPKKSHVSSRAPRGCGAVQRSNLGHADLFRGYAMLASEVLSAGP